MLSWSFLKFCHVHWWLIHMKYHFAGDSMCAAATSQNAEDILKVLKMFEFHVGI